MRQSARARAHVCFEVPLLHERVCVQKPGVGKGGSCSTRQISDPLQTSFLSRHSLAPAPVFSKQARSPGSEQCSPDPSFVKGAMSGLAPTRLRGNSANPCAHCIAAGLPVDGLARDQAPASRRAARIHSSVFSSPSAGRDLDSSVLFTAVCSGALNALNAARYTRTGNWRRSKIASV